jgi:Mn2+/Fe2+ NRAMP family transporter
MIVGPGLIVMEADNDAGAVSTYVQEGAQYGNHLLWVVLLLLPITYFVQEMVARLGIANGKGHAAMIYVRFGKWWGRFSLFDLLFVNVLTLITEFEAISLALDHPEVSPSIRSTDCRTWPDRAGHQRELSALGTNGNRFVPN